MGEKCTHSSKKWTLCCKEEISDTKQPITPKGRNLPAPGGVVRSSWGSNLCPLLAGFKQRATRWVVTSLRIFKKQIDKT